MKLSDAIEQMFYEGNPIGVRCKLCGEFLTYSAMNVADDPYGVKEHYKEEHPEVDIDQLIHEANFSLMVEDGFKREVMEMRKRTGYEGPVIVSDSFGENSWYRDMLNRVREKFRKDKYNLNAEVSKGKFPPTNNWVAEDLIVGQHFGIFTFDHITNDVKIFTDMKDKEKISDNPYDGETLYAVLQDRILERKGYGTNTTIINDEMVRELLHTRMEELVPMLVQHELKKANTKFPPFFDEMHGWAVLKEEIEEADEDLVNIRRWHDQIWTTIRRNQKVDSHHIHLVNVFAQKLMVEAAQVAAMAMKYAAMLERNERKEE